MATSPAPESLYDTNLRPNDVLLGRGAPFLNYQGNKRFRAYVKTQRTLYTTSGRNRMKNEIARQVIAEIGRRGGRFLVCVADEEIRSRLKVPTGTRLWKVAEDDVVMEKCKQALRDKDPMPSRYSQAAIRNQHQLGSAAGFVPTGATSSSTTTTMTSTTTPLVQQTNMWPAQELHQQQLVTNANVLAQQPSMNVAQSALAGLLGALTQQQGGTAAMPRTPSLPTPSLVQTFQQQQQQQQQQQRHPVSVISVPSIAPIANASLNTQTSPPVATQHLQTQLSTALQQLNQQQEQARQLQALGQCLISTGQQLQASLVNEPSTTNTGNQQALVQQAQLLQTLLASGIRGQEQPPQQPQQGQAQRLLMQLLQQPPPQQQQQQQATTSTRAKPKAQRKPSRNDARTNSSVTKQPSAKKGKPPTMREGDSSTDSDQARSVETFPMPDSDLGEVFVREAGGSSPDESTTPSFKLPWMTANDSDNNANGVVSEMTSGSHGSSSITGGGGGTQLPSSMEGSADSSDSDQPKSSSTDRTTQQQTSDLSESSDQEQDQQQQDPQEDQQDKQPKNATESTHSSSDGDVSSNS